jgi:membrane-bound inhibitor of C-type lysozyme
VKESFLVLFFKKEHLLAIAVTYHCGATDLHVLYTGQDRATLTAGSRTVELSRALSGSGARYTGPDGALLWEHQGRARIELGGQAWEDCRPERD